MVNQFDDYCAHGTTRIMVDNDRNIANVWPNWATSCAGRRRISFATESMNFALDCRG